MTEIPIPPELRDPKTLIELQKECAFLEKQFHSLAEIQTRTAQLVQIISTFTQRAMQAEQRCLGLEREVKALTGFKDDAERYRLLINSACRIEAHTRSGYGIGAAAPYKDLAVGRSFDTLIKDLQDYLNTQETES